MIKTRNYPENAKIVHVGRLLRKLTGVQKWSLRVASYPFMLEGAKTDNFSALPMLARGRYVNINQHLTSEESSHLEFSFDQTPPISERKLNAFSDLYPKSKYVESLEAEQTAFSFWTKINGKDVEVLIPQLELARVTVLQSSYMCRAALSPTGISLDFDASYDIASDILTINVMDSHAVPITNLKSNSFQALLAWVLFDEDAMKSFQSIYKNLQLEAKTGSNGWQSWLFKFSPPDMAGWRLETQGRFNKDKSQFLVEQIVGCFVANKMPARVIFKGNGIIETEVSKAEQGGEHDNKAKNPATPILDASVTPNDEYVEHFRNSNLLFSFAANVETEIQARKKVTPRAENSQNEKDNVRTAESRLSSTEEPNLAGDGKPVSVAATSDLGLSMKEAVNRFRLFNDMLKELAQLRGISISSQSAVSELRRVGRSRLHRLKNSQSPRGMKCVWLSKQPSPRSPIKNFVLLEVDVSDGIAPLSTLILYSWDPNAWYDIHKSIQKELVASSLKWPIELLDALEKSGKLSYRLMKHPTDLKNDESSARRWARAVSKKLY